VNLFVSVAFITLLFALIFRFLPDERVPWRDVWLGAFVTSLLFTLGKFLIGVYLGKASIGSAYGAAESLVMEFTQVFATSYGSLKDRPEDQGASVVTVPVEKLQQLVRAETPPQPQRAPVAALQWAGGSSDGPDRGCGVGRSWLVAGPSGKARG
jgi:hypothetical protein